MNEQTIGKFGFSITLGQTNDAGDKIDAANGFLGSTLRYLNPTGSKWFTTVPNLNNFPILHFIKTDVVNSYWWTLDPKQGFTNDLNIYPYALCDFIDTTMGFISPAWQDNNNKTAIGAMKLQDLNNVDIVFTKDKSKWSRCVVIETSTKTLSVKPTIL